MGFGQGVGKDSVEKSNSDAWVLSQDGLLPHMAPFTECWSGRKGPCYSGYVYSNGHKAGMGFGQGVGKDSVEKSNSDAWVLSQDGLLPHMAPFTECWTGRKGPCYSGYVYSNGHKAGMGFGQGVGKDSVEKSNSDAWVLSQDGLLPHMAPFTECWSGRKGPCYSGYVYSNGHKAGMGFGQGVGKDSVEKSNSDAWVLSQDGLLPHMAPFTECWSGRKGPCYSGYVYSNGHKAGMGFGQGVGKDSVEKSNSDAWVLSQDGLLPHMAPFTECWSGRKGPCYSGYVYSNGHKAGMGFGQGVGKDSVEKSNSDAWVLTQDGLLPHTAPFTECLTGRKGSRYSGYV